MEIMGNLHGLPGLFLATTFSAALSSVSGSINALATVFLEDFIRPAYRKVKGQEILHGTLISRLLAVTFGILTMSMAFLTELFGSTVIQIAFSIFGMIGSPLMAILTLGMFVPFVNAWGALCGLVASLGITCWVGFGRIILEIPNDPLPVSTEGCYNTTGPVTTELVPTSDTPERTWLKIYDLSYMYYSVLAMLVAVVVAMPVSLATGRNKGRDLDPRLFFTFASEGPCCGGQEAAGESVESDPGPAASSHIKEPVPDYPMVTLWVDTTSTKRRTAAGGVANQGFTDPMRDLARTEPDLSYRF